MRLAVLASIAFGLAADVACIAASGGAAVMPARYDVAPVISTTDGERARGVRYAAGLSWASFSPRARPPIDVVLGYGLERVSEPADAGADSDRFTHGPFVELGRPIAGDSWQRAWLGLRTEVVFDSRAGRDGAGLGVAARLGWELFRGLERATRNTGVEGALAIGLFAEAGARAGPAGQRAALGLAGLSVRLPAAAAR